jgi:asparagine synthase (glutamine-hydrolysing)
VADVPLGAFLSGGIDSSAVVAAMAEATSRPVKTFSIGFEQEAFDELPHARRVAQQFGTDHEEFVVRPNAVEILPKLVRHYGEPFADSSAIPCFYLAELTRRHVTVALNGDGGDEAFAGYTRYVSNRMAGSFDRLPASVRRLVAAAGRRLPERGEVSSPLNRARRMAGALALDPIERYASYVSLHGADRRAALYTPEYADLVGPVDALDVLRDPWEAASGEDVLDRLLEVDTLTYLPDDLIAKIDIATMAHALEARSPFLDHEMMELAASIPASLKARGTEKKWVLREAMRGWLPDDLLDRPKQGFSVPLSDWFRGELRSYVSDVLLDPSTLARGWFREEAVSGMLDRHAAGADGEAGRIWSLLMLELWHRELVEGRASVPAPALAA